MREIIKTKLIKILFLPLFLQTLFNNSIPDYFEGEKSEDLESLYDDTNYWKIKIETKRKIKDIINKSKIQAISDLHNYMTTVDFHKKTRNWDFFKSGSFADSKWISIRNLNKSNSMLTLQNFNKSKLEINDISIIPSISKSKMVILLNLVFMI